MGQVGVGGVITALNKHVFFCLFPQSGHTAALVGTVGTDDEWFQNVAGLFILAE